MGQRRRGDGLASAVSAEVVDLAETITDSRLPTHQTLVTGARPVAIYEGCQDIIKKLMVIPRNTLETAQFRKDLVHESCMKIDDDIHSCIPIPSLETSIQT